jgi:pilus assembly protein CpaE
MSGEMISVRLEINNLRVRGEIENILSSTGGFHLQDSDSSEACELLILEIGEDLKQEFQLIRSLQSTGAAKAIFLTSPRLEPNVLIEALRAGAKEFFSQPIKGEEVRNALLKFKEGRMELPSKAEKKKRGKIIHLMGSKGGVGVTTLAVNLAASLAQADPSLSVALVDMNLTFGEIPIFLDIKSSFDWAELVKNASRVDSTFLKTLLFKHPSRVSVLPSPTGLDGEVQATPEIIKKLLGVMQETFDFTVIDGGQSIDDLSLRILQMADQVMLVAILNLPCLTNIKRLLWTFQRMGFPAKEKVKIIVNRYQKNSMISLKEAEQSINHEIFRQIPNDFHTTMAAINQGKILSQVDGHSEIQKGIRDLAVSLLQRGRPEKEKTGFWSKIAGKERER